MLISYENEAILARQNGEEIDYVVPSDTLKIENPAAVTVDAGEEAQAFLEFMTGPEAQADYAQSGFRPVVDGVDVGEVEGANDPADPFPAPETLYTIDETFNGWGEAADKYFGDGEARTVDSTTACARQMWHHLQQNKLPGSAARAAGTMP